MTEPRDRYLEEILGQPAAFRRAAATVAARADVLRALESRRVAGGAAGPVLLAGMGSSGDACLATATTLGAAGVLATTVEAAELLHVRRAALAGVGLLVLVSQSGESTEVVRLAEEVRGLDADRRPLVLAITNGLGSPLAALADLALDTDVGREECPSSGTFAGSLVALAAVAGILAGGPVDARVGATAPAGGLVDAVVADVRAAADAAAAASADLLATPDDTGEQLFAWLGGRPTIVALGRGTGRAAAEMASLTLMEAAGVPALSLPTAEFRHGPLEILGPDVAVVLFALEPVTETLDRTFAAELTAAGAAVLLVGPVRPAPPGVELIPVPGPRGILAPAVALGPLQLLARRLAHARGRRPGTFVHAAKVTTRE